VRYFCERVLSFVVGGRRVTNRVKEALTALADALAKRPAEEILFDWFRSGRLVGELSVLIKRLGVQRKAASPPRALDLTRFQMARLIRFRAGQRLYLTEHSLDAPRPELTVARQSTTKKTSTDRLNKSRWWGWLSLALAIAFGFSAISRVDAKIAEFAADGNRTLFMAKSIVAAGLAATSLVLLLSGYKAGDLRLKAFGLEIQGKGSVAVLWICTFLVLIGAAAFAIS
jgi:hypothetical protein